METTIASLHAIRQAGARLVMFTSDNFNKYPEAVSACDAFLKEFPEHANAAEVAVRKAAILGRNDKLAEAVLCEPSSVTVRPTPTVPFTDAVDSVTRAPSDGESTASRTEASCGSDV